MDDTPVDNGSDRAFDMLIIGAGFAGLYMLHRARSLGLSARVLERGGDVGGTWYWNRYPGARCDVESIDYSYSFSEELEQNWSWSERFAAQPEILSYIRFVADHLDLRRDIALNTKVVSAHYDEDGRRWKVVTDADEAFSARFCVMATGALSEPSKPDFAGLDDFAGRWYQTSRWPHDPVDFTGLRVGVIGTGSSGIQCIPEIARQAESLTVFQRTPNFTIPARNTPWDPDEYERFKANYADRRAMTRNSRGGIPERAPDKSALDTDEDERRRALDAHWQRGGNGITMLFNDVLSNEQANTVVADFVRDKIRSTVIDPTVAGLLTPTDHPLGAKRICLDTEYFETYNRPNVRLVDLRANGIQRIDATGIQLAGEHVALDAIVFATGFDALTGALAAIDIKGLSGQTMADAWAGGPRTYLGFSVSGFPNLFLLAGPGTPASLTNVVASIEQHVDWVANCLAWMAANGVDTIEADPAAQEEWVAHVYDAAKGTLMMRANSWYLGANIPGKPRVFMPYVGGLQRFGAIISDVANDNYRGFRKQSERD